MAEQILRDPYNFDLLTLTEPFAERELERGLLAHLRDLLLELGRGFAVKYPWLLMVDPSI